MHQLSLVDFFMLNAGSDVSLQMREFSPEAVKERAENTGFGEMALLETGSWIRLDF